MTGENVQSGQIFSKHLTWTKRLLASSAAVVVLLLGMCRCAVFSATAYRNAASRDDIPAYVEYVRRYPDGKDVAGALKRVYELLWTDAAANVKQDEFNDGIQICYPGGTYEEIGGSNRVWRSSSYFDRFSTALMRAITEGRSFPVAVAPVASERAFFMVQFAELTGTQVDLHTRTIWVTTAAGELGTFSRDDRIKGKLISHKLGAFNTVNILNREGLFFPSEKYTKEAGADYYMTDTRSGKGSVIKVRVECRY